MKNTRKLGMQVLLLIGITFIYSGALAIVSIWFLLLPGLLTCLVITLFIYECVRDYFSK